MKMHHAVRTLPALLFSLSCAHAAENAKKPNILFILADDLGYHDLSCTGSRYYETPNIDRIAAEGMTFSQGYAACQVCSPSRASIMTGKFTARHGITDWIGAKAGVSWRSQNRHSKMLPAEYEHALRAEYVTLPEAMKGAGYKTFFAGKWHLGDQGSLPEDHGFDINKGGWHAGSPAGGYFSPYKNPKLEDGPDGENLSMRLASETVKFLNDNNPGKTGQPVFAFLSFYAVHGPIETSRDKWAKYREKAIQTGIADTGFYMGHFLPIRRVQDNPVYAGLVEQMDDAVGLVLKALRELGLEKNTIVIFTSDNGGVSSGDSFSTSNLSLRGGKGYQFEGGIREPYFIKVPGLTKGGEQCEVPVTGTDFYPTLLELAGQKPMPAEHADGVSLVPLLKRQSIAERPLFWHYPHYGNQGGEPSSIIRLGDWKLIHYYEDQHEELYNLRLDPAETNNVAASEGGITERLHQKLFEFLTAVGARFPEDDPEYQAETEQQFLENVRKNKWPQLEKQRLYYLSEDFDPGNNWWGSDRSEP
ncbi:MAG: sulfatase [Mangrovibacterium sp.]